MSRFNNDRSINVILPIIIVIVVLSNFINPIYLIILTNGILFLLGWNANNAEKYGSSYYSVVVCKEYYRLLTSGFTHSNIAHIFCNMVSLYNLGTHIQSAIGSIPFLLLYFSSMILGCLLTVEYHHKRRKDYTYGIGASIAICGLIGFDIACVLLLGLGSTFTIAYIIKSISPLILCAFMPRVDWVGHFCGLIVGIIASLLIIIALVVPNTQTTKLNKNDNIALSSVKQEVYKIVIMENSYSNDIKDFIYVEDISIFTDAVEKASAKIANDLIIYGENITVSSKIKENIKGEMVKIYNQKDIMNKDDIVNYLLYGNNGNPMVTFIISFEGIGLDGYYFKKIFNNYELVQG